MSPQMIEFGFAFAVIILAFVSGAPTSKSEGWADEVVTVDGDDKSCGKCIAAAKHCLSLPYLSESEAEDWESKLGCLAPSFDFLAGKGGDASTNWTTTSVEQQQYSVNPTFDGEMSRADCIDEIVYYENEQCEKCLDNLSEDDSEFVISEWDSCEDEAAAQADEEQSLDYSDEEEEEAASYEDTDEEESNEDSDEGDDSDNDSLKVFRDQPISSSSSGEEGQESRPEEEDFYSTTTMEPTTPESSSTTKTD